jgi:Ubiquitin family
MRLIFKGKILKDEVTLEEYKIEDGVTVHLVKGKSAASA